MNLMCQKLEAVAAQLSRATEVLGNGTLSASVGNPMDESVVVAANMLQPCPKGVADNMRQSRSRTPVPIDPMAPATGVFDQILPAISTPDGDDDDDDYSGSDKPSDYDDKLCDNDESTVDSVGAADQAASLVTDSYGRLR